MNYCHDIWTGYLTELIVRKSIETCELRCPGCTDNLKSPLLHFHNQMDLFQKMKHYYNEIRGFLLPTIDLLYDNVSHKLPHSNDLVKDKEQYIYNARAFLNISSPESIYYGRYLDHHNDCIINELISTKKEKKSLQPQRPSSLKFSTQTERSSSPKLSQSDTALKKILKKSKHKKKYLIPNSRTNETLTSMQFSHL